MLQCCKLLFISILFLEFLFLNHPSLFSQYSISGYVLYSDNNQPVANDKIYISVYNPNIDHEEFLDSAAINKDGSYFLTTTYPDSVFEKVGLIEEISTDHVPTYYPSTVDWEDAVLIYPPDNCQNVNIYVQRIINQDGPFDLSGVITTIDTNSNNVPLSGAIVIAQQDSIFRCACITDSNGNFTMDSLSGGRFQILAIKIGYSIDSTSILIGSNNRNSIQTALSLNKITHRSIKNAGVLALNIRLSQNFPNPFNPSTKIRFSVPSNIKNETMSVRLVVYDLLGRDVATLVSDNLRPGNYQVEWNAKNNASGVYFYVLRMGNSLQIRKMILLK